MNQLFVIDLHDYGENCVTHRRPSARGIIFVSGKISLVYSEKEKYYKFPGGGIIENEDMKSALIREVREETGFTVKAEKLIAVQDWRKHNVRNYAYGVIKIFVLCKYKDGEFLGEGVFLGLLGGVIGGVAYKCIAECKCCKK